MVVAGRHDPPRSGGPAVKRLAAGTRRLVPDALRRDPDDRWAAAFGRIAGSSFAVAVVSGVLLLPFFRSSMATLAYHGSYSKLDGAPMSQAYRSVLAISFDVRGGLLIRQVHHWSADLFVAAIILRLLRAFFRGRFSGRALPDWLIWVTLLPLGMFAAYTGTILPDDMLSGGSLSVITGVLLSVPVIGTHLVFWIFGGAPPGHQIIGRDYWVHILVLPALAGALLLASFRPSLRWPRRVRPDPLLPFTCATLVLLGAIAQINPVWLVGPYQPGSISSGAVPDWYQGFLDGALRVMPAWELPVAGHRLDLGVLIPGLVVPALFFTCLALYPLADRRIAGGRPPRGLLPPTPADPANRTAARVAGVTFYGLLWAAAANDQIAYHLHLDLYMVTWSFRVLVLAGPPLAFALTRVICHALAGRRREEDLHGRETGRIVRNPHGGFTEIREPAHRAALPGAGPPGPAAGRRAPLPRATRPCTGKIPWLGPCPAQTAARPADPERKPDAMDTPSLIAVLMPVTTLIALCTGIALPFIAGCRSGRSHAGGPLASADARKRVGAAGRTARPREPGANDAAPAGYLYLPCARTGSRGQPARTPPLGPAGAGRQEDGHADLLHQRQLGPARGRGRPRLHQPRTVRDRHPVPRALPAGRRPARCAPRTAAATATACMSWPRALTAARPAAAGTTARQTPEPCGAHGTGTPGSTARTGKTAVTATRPA